MKRLWLFIPLAILMAVLGLMFVIYHTLDYEKDSPMVGQHVPSLILESLGEGEIDLADLEGQDYVLHIGASWCESCRMEHSLIENLKTKGLPIIGIFYKDTPEDVQSYLEDYSNPYEIALLDNQGQSLVHLGAVSLPTTYLVNQEGIIQTASSGPLKRTDPLFND